MMQTLGGYTKALFSYPKKYGLTGTSYDYSSLTSKDAYAQFTNYLKDGPVIVSVHYKFDPKSSIPHLVVIDGIDDSTLYYNDPSGTSGEKKISIADFQKGWKRKFIVVRPVADNSVALS